MSLYLVRMRGTWRVGKVKTRTRENHKSVAPALIDL
jgi:hypothetical protein